MNAEQLRAIVRKLPHLEQTVQWGENLVFWVGDKAIGGKMFALVDLSARVSDHPSPVISFSAGPQAYAELLETEGILPAPYMARIHWVALAHWDALPPRELADWLAKAHALTYAKLSKRTKDILGLPAAERRRLIAERRQASAEAKKPAKAQSKAILAKASRSPQA